MIWLVWVSVQTGVSRRRLNATPGFLAVSTTDLWTGTMINMGTQYGCSAQNIIVVIG